MFKERQRMRVSVWFKFYMVVTLLCLVVQFFRSQQGGNVEFQVEGFCRVCLILFSLSWRSNIYCKRHYTTPERLCAKEFRYQRCNFLLKLKCQPLCQQVPCVCLVSFCVFSCGFKPECETSRQLVYACMISPLQVCSACSLTSPGTFLSSAKTSSRILQAACRDWWKHKPVAADTRCNVQLFGFSCTACYHWAGAHLF